MEGRVIQSTGSWYEVLLQQDILLNCRLKGKLRLSDKKLTNPVAVGDVVDVETDEDGSAGIVNIHARKNYIVRSDTHKKEFKNIIAANIDQTIIIASLFQPRTSYGFIDRILLTAEVYGIPAYVIFNKHDLYKNKQNNLLKEFMFSYNQAGYISFSTSIITEENIKKLKNILLDKTSLLIGHSGVGKSTLINYIEPGLNLKVKEISKYSEKGQHTTTFGRMHTLSAGGFIIDTPGIKEFGIVDIAAEEAGHYFPEIRAIMNTCKFNNCLHINESGCAVKQRLETGHFSPTRYTSYLTIYEEIKTNKKWY